jgi:hypothetical protein
MDRYNVLRAVVILALLLGSLAGVLWLQAAR